MVWLVSCLGLSYLLYCACHCEEAAVGSQDVTQLLRIMVSTVMDAQRLVCKISDV